MGGDALLREEDPGARFEDSEEIIRDVLRWESSVDFRSGENLVREAVFLGTSTRAADDDTVRGAHHEASGLQEEPPAR
jgi:hypothetical protein